MAQRELSNISTTPQPLRAQGHQGAWLWVLQRVSSLALLLFLGIHLWFHHFTRPGDPAGLGPDQRIELYPMLYALNYTLLLASGLFHGLNGIRTLVYDMTTQPGARRFTSLLLLLLGGIFFVLGTVTLWSLV